MLHIHPFPARMAPEIALKKLSELKKGQTVLDPMSGSGMVLSIASRHNITAIGVDMDPLAQLISRVGSTRIIEKDAILGLENLLDKARKSNSYDVRLPWIDGDEETRKFIAYWFADKQIQQLRVLAHFLVSKEPLIEDKNIRNILFIALSRLIISKEPKASLARDTAHSRPHRTITDNDFDIFEALPVSLKHVLRALNTNEIKSNAKTYLGDARNLKDIKDGEIDTVITSPPYLNAIDYMRGHKFSLVWLGYRISDLRKIRAMAIGAECSVDRQSRKEFDALSKTLQFDKLEPKKIRVLERYFDDLCIQLQETNRVLKKGGFASYVVGNSAIRGKLIENNELLKKAATLASLEVVSENIREIPDNSRYLPIIVHKENSLSKRMRTEHVITLSKPDY
jgi:DNA modification methylase